MKAKLTFTLLGILLTMSLWGQVNQKPANIYELLGQRQNNGPVLKQNTAEQDSILQARKALENKILLKAPPRTQTSKSIVSRNQQKSVQQPTPKPIKRHKMRSGVNASSTASPGASGEQVVVHQKDNPGARAEFDWLRTRDPVTNKIPENIRSKELNFMRVQNENIGIPFSPPGDILSPWINRGPHNVGGRTRALAVDTNDERIILAGGVSGGMWRSTDQGATWSKTTGSNELQSVSCIAQDIRNGQTSTWYYGTGEISGNSASGSGAFYNGDGIYKSTDNGATWTLLTATSTKKPESFDQNFDFNYEIVVNPTNGHVLVANYGGIYRSTDGGNSFTLVLAKTAVNTGMWVDVVMTSTGTAYAAFDEKGIFKSTDGTNWTSITPASNFPLVSGERKELALAPSNENIFYLLGENASHASGHSLWKYDDSNGSWTDLSGSIPQLGGRTGNFDSQGGYDLLIKVKNDNENFVVIGGTNLFASTDGFSSTNSTSWIGGYTPTNATFGLYTNHHPDQHSFVFLANNRALSGNDGGVQITENITDVTQNGNQETVDWISLNNGYLTTQVYALSAGPGDQIMAGFQDNSTWLTTSPNSTASWTDQFGGDGAYNAFNSDGKVRYLSSQRGNIFRVNYNDGADDISADGFTEFAPSNYSAGLFIVPFYLDPTNDELFYLGGNSTFFVNTQASTGSSSVGWKTIPLNTTGVVSEIGVTGSNMVYVGTSAGQVFKVVDPGGNETVTNVTGSNFPNGYVSGIGVNQRNPDQILITFSNYSILSVFYSSDGGSTWSDVSGSLEENTDGSGSGPSVRSARILGDGDRYFVGTSTGLYSTKSLSGGNIAWTQENSSGIGDVVVEHLVAREDGLVLAGTHGNGIYSSKFEVSGLPENDIALTGITAPQPLVSGVESITVSLENEGTQAQSNFELSLFVNNTAVATETFTETINSGAEAQFTFSATYDFSAQGEYTIRVDLTAGDEVAGNNSVSKFVVNAMYTGRYVLRQNNRTTSGPSGVFGNGYLFSETGTDLITIFYVDANTRGASGVYLPRFHNNEKFFNWTMTNGEVVFGANQSTGLSCSGTEIVLGTADGSGTYSTTNDSEFTLTLKEDANSSCGNGSPNVDFFLYKQLENDLAITTIESPRNNEFIDVHPVTITLFNVGSKPQSNFEVSYYVDNVLKATETITKTLESGERMHYTFDQEHDFAVGGTFNIKATVNLSGDEWTNNDEVTKQVIINTLLGFEGPFSMIQVAPTTVGSSSAFANGYLFDPSGSTPVFVEDLGGGERQFSAIYLPAFTATPRDYRFTMEIEGSRVIFENNQSTGIGCGDNIILGTADTPGTFDINNSSEFTLTLKEDVNNSCGAGTGDVEFRLVSVAPYNDLSVVDIPNPNNLFPNTTQNITAAVHNFSNVPQGDFNLTFSVNGTEVATETVTGGIGIQQTIFYTFQTPYDFSNPGVYEIKVEVDLTNDEFTDNDAHVKSVESLAPIASFPYAENFDSGTLPIGWQLNNGDWGLINTPSQSNNTGPAGDNTSGSGYYLQSDGSNAVNSNLNSRHIDLNGLTSPLLTFYYHMFGTPTSTLEIQIDGRPVFSVSGQQQRNQNDPYIQGSVNLNQFTDQTVNIQFVVTNSGSGSQEIVALDDIGIKEALDHDLTVRTIMSPATRVFGVEAITATIVNLGRRSQSEFEVSYYVDNVKVSTELFTDVIRAGQSVDFTFDKEFDFATQGNYELRVEIDLPTDELLDNNIFSRQVTRPGDRGPFTGAYRMEQLEQTTTGASATFASGYLFSGTNIIDVDLVYVDDNTRSVSLHYLAEFSSGPKDYTFTLMNGEAVFVDNQESDIGCNGNIVLGTADSPGSYDANDDNQLILTIKEDVTNNCGAGSVDATFLLTKQGGSFEYDLEMVGITTPQQNIPLSSQAIGFQVRNAGSLPQHNFEASYFVDDVLVASETFTQQFALQPGGFRNFTFSVPFDFHDLDVYNVEVELTRATDDNPMNDEAFLEVRTSAFNINATPVFNSRIGVEWVNLSDVTSAVLERTDPAGNFEDLATISSGDTHYIDENVDPNTTYGYRMRSVLPSGETNFSSTVFAHATIEGDFAFHKVLGDITGVDLSNNTYSSSWADLDGDGDLDMVVSNVPNFNPNLSIPDVPSLYLNDGSGNFEKVLSNTIIDEGVSSRSASIIDYNNDGRPDVYLSGFNSRIGNNNSRIFRNDGNMNFTSLEIPTLTIDKTLSSEEGSWADMDNDGDLDLFVAGNFFAGNVDFFYENRGDGRFESITTGVIYETMYNSGIFSWAASWVDYDGDGDQDLFVPVDGNANPAVMFRNLGDGTFERDETSKFVQEPLVVRGAQWADFDQDGDQDLLMVDRTANPVFFFNEGTNGFERKESKDVLGVDLNVHRISSVGDINNNGKLDLIFASNGYFVYESNNDKTFTLLENVLPEVNRNGLFAGISLADMDGDGDLDLFRGNASSGYNFNFLYENQGNSNNWLHINLKGEFSNADGIGAVIEVTTGTVKQYRTVTSSTGLIGQNSLIAEFGLGANTKADNIKVTWPSGTVKELFDVQSNQLIEINDSNAPTDVGLSNAVLPENLSSGAPVGASFSVDTDKKDTHTYEIVNTGGGSAGGANKYLNKNKLGTTDLYSPSDRSAYEAEEHDYTQENTDGDNFVIEGGTIKAATNFDFETQSSYSVRVRSTDAFGNTFEKVIEIGILDVNEDIPNNAPTDLTLSATRIKENEPVNSTIGTLTATDADTENTHTYSLVDGDASLFKIEGNTLKTAESFNFEEKNELKVTIRTIDDGGKSFDKEYVISVDNVNETPIELFLSNTKLTENLVSGSLVGALSTVDTDKNDTHTYALSGEDAASFQVLGSELLTLAPLDFETKSSYKITVTSTDAAGLTVKKDFTITISDQNDAPGSLTVSSTSVAELLPKGSVIATLSTTDDDPNDTHTYAVSGTDAAKFKVLDNELRTAEKFNFEAVSVYNIKLTVTDNGGASRSSDVVINVTDANDTPATLTLSNANLPEGVAAGSLIGVFATTDEDANDSHTFTLVSGTGSTDNASFTVDGTTLKSAAQFDFETKSTYSIRMKVSDGKGGDLEKQFTINITDINEASPNLAPTDISLTAATVSENVAVGTTIGTLSSTDPDANDTHTYSLVNGSTALFMIDGSLLKTGAEFNFESGSSYSITIRTTDAGGLIFDEAHTITVNNVNEAPKTLALSNNTLNEGVATGTAVGSLTATDDDSGDTQSYSLSGADAANFKLAGAELQTAVELDFETKSTHQLTITVTDAGGLTLSKDMTISIKDVNEQPTAITLSASSITEGTTIGTSIGTLSTVDQDAGNTHTYSISGTDAASFQVVIDQIRNKEVFNFETKSSYSITVTTTDQDGLTTSSDFNIAVTDTNDAPTAMTLSNSSVNEGAAGSTVGTLSLTDEDASDTETYAISGIDGSNFEVVGNELQSSVILNFEVKSTYNITVTGSDGAGASISADYVVTVSDVNEAPTALTLSANAIDEGAASGTAIGAITFSDEDAGDTHTLSISGTDASKFQIVNNELQNAEVLNFEEKANLDITITVTDAGGLTADQNVTINVNDVNDAPSGITLSNTEIQEMQDPGTVVGLISVQDEDASDTHTLTLSGNDAASFEIVGEELRSKESFDFDVKSSYAITLEASDGALSTTEDFTIMIANVTGIDDDERLVNIYPNPARHMFTVSLDRTLQSFQWNLYDLKGNRIGAAVKVIEQTDSHFTLDVSSLSSGEYILEIIDASRRITKQVIINN